MAHLTPSVAYPRPIPSLRIASIRSRTGSDRGQFTAVMDTASPGRRSMDLAMRVTSLYPRMRSMGTTNTRDVRNWGPS